MSTAEFGCHIPLPTQLQSRSLSHRRSAPTPLYFLQSPREYRSAITGPWMWFPHHQPPVFQFDAQRSPERSFASCRHLVRFYGYHESRGADPKRRIHDPTQFSEGGYEAGRGWNIIIIASRDKKKRGSKRDGMEAHSIAK